MGAPLYGVGAVVTHGAGRWVMLAMFVLLACSACLRPRRQSRHESLPTMVFCAAVVVMWGAVAPDQTILLTAVVAVGMIYLALMARRPYAEIGLVMMTVAYVGSQWAFGARGDLAWQVAGVAVTDLALGALILSIRIMTERKVDERSQALAAANDRLEQLTRTDPLTGLANRRRLAGEEFAVVMAGADLEAACRVAERIRTAIAGLGEEHATSPSGFLTVSAGVAAGGPGGGVVAKEGLIQLADERLYAAKRGGRNRVVADSVTRAAALGAEVDHRRAVQASRCDGGAGESYRS